MLKINNIFKLKRILMSMDKPSSVSDLPASTRKPSAKTILISSIILALVIILVSGFVLQRKVRNSIQKIVEPNQSTQQEKQSDSDAVKAGKNLSNNKCEGEGPVTLTVSPMKSEDIAMIIPYGLMIGGHVTPIDHQYFSPAIFHSPQNTYEVRAMAAGRITNISHRSKTVGNASQPSNDYRFVFAHTCTFLTYYDLVTGLAPDIKAEFDKNAQVSGSNSNASLDIPIKAGQLVGYIGGQTLDFAVWDTQKPLKNFITPNLYKGESWKIYTADPLDYYGPELKELALAKYLRTDAGKSGRIDWDIDGKLVGNWFQKDTNGYEGDRQQADGKYWRGHLAVAPEHLDPSFYVASFGTFAQSGDGKQFAIKTAVPDPAMVDTASGLVKYDLYDWSYTVNGKFWDRMSGAKDPKVVPNAHKGCALFQLVSARELKAEPFPGKTCAKVTTFTSAAKTFIR